MYIILSWLFSVNEIIKLRNIQTLSVLENGVLYREIRKVDLYVEIRGILFRLSTPTNVNKQFVLSYSL